MLTATHINYYKICHRKLWLFSHGITMEHTSELVSDGKLLHETSYSQRAQKHTEITLEATFCGVALRGKVDFYDHKTKTIHETKRGKSMEQAHIWQLRFYIWLFVLNGMDGVCGIIEYPKLRERHRVALSEEDILFFEREIPKINRFLVQETSCPSVLNVSLCKKCSYYEFCYID